MCPPSLRHESTWYETLCRRTGQLAVQHSPHLWGIRPPANHEWCLSQCICIIKMLWRLITVWLVAVGRLYTDEDVLVQKVLWVGDDRGELERIEKTMDGYWLPQQVIVRNESSFKILPQLGCQIELLLTRLSALCSPPPESWLFL